MTSPRIVKVVALWMDGEREASEALIRELSLDELVELCVRLDRAKELVEASSERFE